MAGAKHPSPSIGIEIPPWLWGGMPEEFFAQAELHVRGRNEQGAYLVQTDEGYRRTRPALVATTDLAAPGSRRTQFDVLTTVGRTTAMEVNWRAPNIASEMERLARRAENGELIDRLHYSKLALSIIDLENLTHYAESTFNEIREIQHEDNPSEKPFSNAGFQIVRRTNTLIHRVKLPTVLLRIEHDKRLRTGDATHVKESLKTGNQIFISGQGLLKGFYLFDTYLGALLGSASPGVWGFTAHRSFGPLVLSFGRTIAGLKRGPAEMLHLLPHDEPSVGTWSTLDLHPTSCTAAVRWWANALNTMFGILSDVTHFAGESGTYSASLHHQMLMTVEQLFARVSSILTSHRDGHVRHVLLFTVLDTLERLTRRDIERLCSLSTAEKALDVVRDELPLDAARVLLPLANRAISALKDLQAGFFLDDLTGKMDPERAAAKYVKVLRNATHGHGSNKAGRVAETSALLAQHDGDVPHDLALLGYLYLLELLARPAVLKRVMPTAANRPVPTS